MSDETKPSPPLLDTPDPSRHPMFGCMRGMITFAEGYYPAEPAFTDEEWDEILEARATRFEECLNRAAAVSQFTTPGDKE